LKQDREIWLAVFDDALEVEWKFLATA